MQKFQSTFDLVDDGLFHYYWFRGWRYFKKYVFYDFKEIRCDIIAKIISTIANNLASMPVLQQRRSYKLIWISNTSPESSKFNSEISITAALVNFALRLTSSILSNKLLILSWRKCLNTFHSSWPNCRWLWNGPGY